jgi:HEXXH motif-containing protein
MLHETDANEDTIDWSRLAEPQTDGYDTDAILLLMSSENTPWRPRPFQRPHGKPPTVAHGTVSVNFDDTEPLIPGPRFAPVEGLHPNLERALNYVERWPVVAKQWPQFIHRIQCYTDTAIPEEERPHRLASASHSIDARFGEVALTIDCDLTTAQCIVHEMAHHKLRAIGIANERAVRIVTNPPAMLYESPVVLDQPRPMTAVLHAEYTFIHVTQLDIEMLRAEKCPQTRARIMSLLKRNLVRVEKGLQTIQRHISLDQQGESFIGAFINWSKSVIETGNAIMNQDKS